MNRIVIVLGIMLASWQAKALDEDYSPDINALYRAKLIVTCTVEPGDNFRYHVNILNILKNESGIKVEKQERLEMIGNMWSGFGQKGMKHAAAYVVYLNPHEGKWLPFTTQHSEPLKKGKIPFEVCDTTFYLGVTEYRVMRREMFLAFERKSSCHYTPLVSEADYIVKRNNSFVVKYFYKWNDRACNRSDYDFEESIIPLPEEPMPVVDKTPSDFCDPMADFIGGMKGYMDYCASALPDSISNNPEGIQGKYYVRFVVEKDSSLTNIEILRSIHPGFDPAIIDLIQGISKMVLGELHGRPARCRYTVPIVIRPTGN